ncbi:hypothetical protein MO973_19670 [Paenibacillus sp. TRM 82003]|nr:hypothetical protein [Paenibacillus sp. TRM 82003]
MTRDEVLAMEPGRELDALVARKVMGWMQAWSPSGKCEAWFEQQDDGSMRGIHDLGWNPSKSISATWEVAEKFETIDVKRFVTDKGLWFCGITENNKWYRSFAPTAPEAICKAALLAVMDL